MTEAERLAELREIFMGAPEAVSTRILALVASLTLAIIVLWLVRRRTLREEYTPIWLAVAGAIAAISIWPGLLLALTRLVGAWTPRSTLFFLRPGLSGGDLSELCGASLGPDSAAQESEPGDRTAA